MSKIFVRARADFGASFEVAESLKWAGFSLWRSGVALQWPALLL
jgi:hypothetical protein